MIFSMILAVSISSYSVIKRSFAVIGFVGVDGVWLWAGVGNVAITACYKPTNQYYSGNVISSDANPDVAINIYRSSTNSMPEVNLKNLIGNKFADVVITRNGTSYSVGPRAGIGTRYLQRTSSISNSGGGQYMRWGTTPSPFYAYDVPYNVFT